MVLSNGGNDVVLWNTHRFPADFLLEFSVLPHDANKGLNIVFFAAMGRKGGGIFDLGSQDAMADSGVSQRRARRVPRFLLGYG